MPGVVRANYVADATVFVGEWLTHLPVWREHRCSPSFVIRNGADTAVFHPRGLTPWTGQGPLRLVTHHWGYHPMKGFDVYRQVDDVLSDPAWRERLYLYWQPAERLLCLRMHATSRR